MATTETPWGGSTGDKLYLNSGQFSATIRDSQDVSGVDTECGGMEWDGTNTPWYGSSAEKLYLQSGKFSATLKDSESVAAIDQGGGNGISWDGTNTPWSSDNTTAAGTKLLLQSGQFSATLKTSFDCSGIATATDISYNNDGNTAWGS